METDKTNPEEPSPAESHDNAAATPEVTSAESASPVSPPPFEPTPTPAGRESPTWLRRNAPWLAAILITLLVGFGLAFFLLYQPAQQSLQIARQDAEQKAEAITKLETDLEDTRLTLDQTRSDLKTTTDTLKELHYQSALTALQTNVAYARLALVTKDVLTARQELSAAQTNLKKFTPLLGDKEIETVLTERLALVRSSISSDPTKGLEELRILAENLSRLEKP